MQRSLSFCVLASGLVAQQFAPFDGRAVAEIPPGRWSVIALADCDGDGDQDAAVNDRDANLFAVLRQGPGHTWTTIGLLPGIVSAAAWADFDGDGDLDLLVGATGTQSPAPFGLFRNDGGPFPWLGSTPGLLTGRIERFAIGDLDGDLRPDVVVGTTTGVQVVRNLGNSIFGTATVVTNRADAKPALFDRDGDGDLDLAVASTVGVALFDNVAGVFVPSGGALPTGTVGSDVAAKDFDGDGRIDLALVNGGTIDVLWNEANGWLLAAAVVPAGEAVREVLSGDLDRDGDGDLVVRTEMTADWLRNDGNRSFLRLPALRHGAPWWIGALALGDGAARGAVDVVAAFGDGQVRTLYGAAPQPFLDPQAMPAPSGQNNGGIGGLAVGDIDGDGRLDIISPWELEILHDDGRGRYSRQPITGARTGYREAWLADLDVDGDLDLLLSINTAQQPWQQSIQRLANDGLGHFTPVQDIAMFGNWTNFRFGDVDGDGDADMLAPNGPGVVEWFQNVGNGALVHSGLIPSAVAGGFGMALVFADLDGDGDRDIVSGQQANYMLPVFLNNGNGVFTAAAPLQLSPATAAQAIEAADLDGDGALDIAVLQAGVPSWFRNNGVAGFTRVLGAFPAGSNFSWLKFVDIDEDGDLDLETEGYPIKLLVNDGHGVFADATARLWSASFGQAKFADLDEDGDVDMFVITANGRQRVLDRLRGAESRQVVRAGGAMQVRFFVQPHAPVPGALVLPMAALGPGPSQAIAGIRGKLLLPLASMVMLGAVDASSGTATTGFAIPPVAGLLGLELCVQGLVLGQGVQLGFTNVVDERILP